MIRKTVGKNILSNAFSKTGLGVHFPTPGVTRPTLHLSALDLGLTVGTY